MSDKWLLIEHNKIFTTWFNERIYDDESTCKSIRWMPYMPKFNLITWTVYNINKFYFYIKSKDDHSTLQSSGTMVEAESMYFSNYKYMNHIMHSRPYFGFI